MYSTYKSNPKSSIIYTWTRAERPQPQPAHCNEKDDWISSGLQSRPNCFQMLLYALLPIHDDGVHHFFHCGSHTIPHVNHLSVSVECERIVSIFSYKNVLFVLLNCSSIYFFHGFHGIKWSNIDFAFGSPQMDGMYRMCIRIHIISLRCICRWRKMETIVAILWLSSFCVFVCFLSRSLSVSLHTLRFSIVCMCCSL